MTITTRLTDDELEKFLPPSEVIEALYLTEIDGGVSIETRKWLDFLWDYTENRLTDEQWQELQRTGETEVNTDLIPVHTSASSTVVNGVPISRTRVKGKGLNLMWFAADCVPFDVRWLGADVDEWLDIMVDGDWKDGIRTLIGDRNMTEWLKGS